MTASSHAMNSPDLSIIIVNWKSAGYVRKCLESVYKHTTGLRFEVIVVDGGSFDGCGEMLAREFPEARFIQCQSNVGFARANNLGYEQARGEVVCFLNPDTELAGPALNVLHRALASVPGAGIIGAKLMNTNGTLQISCVASFPTILNQVLDFEVLRRAFPRLGLWGMAPLFCAGEELAEAEVLSGACLMMARATFEKIGRFSEDYFMYSEDVDLCYKAHRAGAKNYYMPAAVVVHHGGGSSGSSASGFSAVMMRESRWRYFRKFRGRTYAAGYRLSMAAAAVVRCGLLAPAMPLASAQRRMGLKNSLHKWLNIFRWAAGLGGVSIPTAAVAQR
jgi:GT2 family glycosyltransferase